MHATINLPNLLLRSSALMASVFLLALPTCLLRAQPASSGAGQVEFGAALTFSNPLRLNRHYTAGAGESDISSSASPGVEGQLGLSGRFSKHFRWMAAIAYGVYSYNIALYVTDEFNRLGWGGYTDRYTHYEIRYSSLLGGIRADFPIRRNDVLFLQPALRLSYPWRSYSELAAFALPDNGGVKQVFQAEMINNDQNKVILCPELGLFYQLNPESGRLGLISGLNAVYSNRYPFTGDYRIVGDSDTREGTLAKRFLHLGASLSVFWKLDG